MRVQPSIFHQGEQRGRRVILEKLQTWLLGLELPDDRSDEFKDGFATAVLIVAAAIQKEKRAIDD